MVNHNKLVDESKIQVTLNQARLFARIHEPHQLIEAESYNVDLAEPLFQVVWGKNVVSEAEPQLIATYVESESEWLWGIYNPSTDPISSEKIREPLIELGVIADGKETLELSHKEAYDLAAALAHKLGYEAMYPARAGSENVHGFLALNFKTHRDLPATPETNWCVGCGSLPQELEVRMAAGPGGRGFCESCAENPIAMLQMKEAASSHFLNEVDQDVSLGEEMDHIVCAMCEGRTERIMMEYTSICFGCIDKLRKAFA